MKKAKKAKKVSRASSSKMERVPTGIPNFDTLIEGGLEKNSTNLVIGGAGSGKSIFATQFLVNGMKNGERCLYVTFEERKKEFYLNMLRFGWDLAEYEKKGLFFFLEYAPEKVKTMLEEGGGAIENHILKNKISRVVIDSISSFALLFGGDLEKKEAALNLFAMISAWNCTSLVTLEGDPSKGVHFGTETIEFESDAIIAFYFLRDKVERERYLEILKMRGTKHSKKIFSFDITQSGIKVTKKPYSGKIA
jgi:circadian clock protein KaiC